jgi:hypothetical protein
MNDPMQLAADVQEKILDPTGRRHGLCAQKSIEHHALVAIAEPCIADALDQQRDRDDDEQRGEVPPEERRLEPCLCAVHRQPTLAGVYARPVIPLLHLPSSGGLAAR